MHKTKRNSILRRFVHQSFFHTQTKAAGKFHNHAMSKTNIELFGGFCSQCGEQFQPKKLIPFSMKILS